MGQEYFQKGIDTVKVILGDPRRNTECWIDQKSGNVGAAEGTQASLDFFIEMSERTQMSLDFLIELRL